MLRTSLWLIAQEVEIISYALVHLLKLHLFVDWFEKVTTDRGKSACATTHGGTSAAAPNAAGVIALALSVRYAL